MPIARGLYLKYKLLFIFDNATNHAIYGKDVLQVAYMNKSPRDQQTFLQVRWYEAANGDINKQEMYLLTKNLITGQSTKVQKKSRLF